MPDPVPTQPAGQAQGFNPADLDIVSLMGTLMQSGLLGPSQAQLDQQRQEMHGQVQQAQGQADQAQQAWQQANENPPQSSPGEGFFQGLLGNTASVLTQNPMYAKQAADQMDQQHTELLKNRMQNLASLKDIFDRRAAAAEKLQNLELTLKNKQSSEQVAKQWQALHEVMQQKHQDAMLGVTETGKDRRQSVTESGLNKRSTEAITSREGIAASKAGPAPDEINLDDYTDETTTGHKYIDLTGIPDKKDQRVISQMAHQHGLPVMKDGSPIKTLEAVRDNLNDLEGYAGKLEANNALTRPFVALKNKAGAATQLDPNAGSFATTRQNVITLMQGLAAAGKGNRIMQKEIEIGLHTLPTLYDTKDVGGKKIAKTRKALDNIERALIGGRGPRVPQLSTGGNAKTQVLNAIRKAGASGKQADIDQVNAILDRNPELEKDQNINDLVDEMLNKRPAQ